jgi:hypothetical protein
MMLAELREEDLVFIHEAEAATGIPRNVIRVWAHRGKIRKFPGDGRPNGLGHNARTMYALPEIEAQAETYQRTPQRAPKRAT